MTELKHLFSPLRVGSMELKNRIVLLPTALGYAQDGVPSKRLTTYLEERARGGVGCMETPCSFFPASEGIEGTFMLDASDRDHIPAFRKLTDLIHSYGVPIVGQLITLMGWRREKGGPYELVYPSVTAMRRREFLPPREITVEEIGLFVRQHGDAAKILRESGFDAVEVMGGVGAVLSRFMSPLANLRTDDYGGSFEKRMRLPLEIIAEIKKKAGEDFPLLWRYSGHEFMEGGFDVEEAGEIGRCLEKAGVKWLNLQVGWHDSPIPLITKEVPQGHWVYIAERIKKKISIPVMTTYRITDPVMADRIVAEGRADLIGMARALFCDPEFPNKAKEGRLDEINRCICCCRCVDQAVGGGKPFEICSVNPRIGPELDTPLEPAARKKRILVVGGGVAGMEAARVAALRGHQVTLWERSDRLGGLLDWAMVPPNKTELRYVLDYLGNQLRRLGVDVRVLKEATAEAVIMEKPGAVVVATGSHPIVPLIPGIEGPNVVLALDVLAGKADVGQRVVIVGGGKIGCETAQHLLTKGKTITIVEMLAKIGVDIGASERFITVNGLRQAGVALEPNAKVVEITPEGVKTLREGSEVTFEGDTVVISVGMEATKDLEKALRGKVDEIYAVGDCVEPKRIGDAIKAAYLTARDI
ncbi:MAG: FAD-dependent oxidoreductase [Deltaproteobacteria bacterium]|nr:FAD-dependent oxidoreductase [Deltaproteobacteria bacterium]